MKKILLLLSITACIKSMDKFSVTSGFQNTFKNVTKFLCSTRSEFIEQDDKLFDELYLACLNKPMDEIAIALKNIQKFKAKAVYDEEWADFFDDRYQFKVFQNSLIAQIVWNTVFHEPKIKPEEFKQLKKQLHLVVGKEISDKYFFESLQNKPVAVIIEQ